MYQGECRSTAEKVAIKHIKVIGEYDYSLVKLIREIKLMRLLTQRDCHFIPLLLDVMIPENEIANKTLNNVFLVMEYEPSDLRSLFNAGSSVKFTQEHARHIVFNLLCAVEFLH